jgi:hypothetical protein
MMTIRMMSTTPAPNRRVEDPSAGPRRRSYTLMRRLGAFEGEDSGIGGLLSRGPVYVEGIRTSSAPLFAQWSETRANLF